MGFILLPIWDSGIGTSTSLSPTVIVNGSGGICIILLIATFWPTTVGTWFISSPSVRDQNDLMKSTSAFCAMLTIRLALSSGSVRYFAAVVTELVAFEIIEPGINKQFTTIFHLEWCRFTITIIGFWKQHQCNSQESYNWSHRCTELQNYIVRIVRTGTTRVVLLGTLNFFHKKSTDRCLWFLSEIHQAVYSSKETSHHWCSLRSVLLSDVDMRLD